MKKNRFTMDEIAQACGVSRITVHRVLYKPETVKAETREPILKFIESVNFVSNKSAMALSSKHSKTIGLILHNISTEFSSQVYNVVYKLCSDNQYDLVLASSDNDPEKEEKNVRLFVEMNVEGIIVFSVSQSADNLQIAVDNGVSVLQLLSVSDCATSSVTIDEKSITKQLTQHLVDSGHSNFLYVNGYYGQYLCEHKNSSHYNYSVYQQRQEGFCTALEDNNIDFSPDRVIDFYHRYYQGGNFLFQELQLAIEKYQPTAIVCYDDYTALCVMTYLKKWGYKVPQDISITGHDNIETLKFIESKLTTIEYKISNLGQKAMQILLDGIVDNKVQNIELEARVVLGNSVKKL